MDASDLPAPLSEDAARHVERATMVDVASGSTAALAQVYDLTSGHVFGLLLGLLNDRASAEALLQETYVDVWQRAGGFSAQAGDLVGWVCEIAHRRAVDRLREAGSPAVEVIAISEAMQGLPPAESECVALAYYAGLTQQEIASRTGRPLADVRTRTRTGLSRLRDLAHGGGPTALPAVPA